MPSSLVFTHHLPFVKTPYRCSYNFPLFLHGPCFPNATRQPFQLAMALVQNMFYHKCFTTTRSTQDANLLQSTSKTFTLHPQCQCLQDYQVITRSYLAKSIMFYACTAIHTLHHTNFIIYVGNTCIHKLVYRYIFIYYNFQIHKTAIALITAGPKSKIRKNKLHRNGNTQPWGNKNKCKPWHSYLYSINTTILLELSGFLL